MTYVVEINEGPLAASDNAIYYCNEKPGYLLIQFDSPGGDEVKFGRFVEFKPTNGHNKGKRVQVPIERVVSIADSNPGGEVMRHD